MNARVEKYLPDGTLAISYDGELLARGDGVTVFGGRFVVDLPKPYVYFRRGDRTVETFYHDRWYHIVELRDVDDDRLKGWYCNITRPPTITEMLDILIVAYVDLALDVWVAPDGELLVLDEDELDALQLDDATLAQAWHAVELLRAHAARRDPPFNQISGVL